jgi:ribosomal protein S11
MKLKTFIRFVKKPPRSRLSKLKYALSFAGKSRLPTRLRLRLKKFFTFRPKLVSKLLRIYGRSFNKSIPPPQREFFVLSSKSRENVRRSLNFSLARFRKRFNRKFDHQFFHFKFKYRRLFNKLFYQSAFYGRYLHPTRKSIREALIRRRFIYVVRKFRRRRRTRYRISLPHIRYIFKLKRSLNSFFVPNSLTSGTIPFNFNKNFYYPTATSSRFADRKFPHSKYTFLKPINYSFRRFPPNKLFSSRFKFSFYIRSEKKRRISFKRYFVSPSNRFKKRVSFRLNKRKIRYIISQRRSNAFLNKILFVRKKKVKSFPFLGFFAGFGSRRFILKSKRKRYLKFIKRFFNNHKYTRFGYSYKFHKTFKKLSRIKYYFHIFRSVNNIFVNVTAPKGRSVLVYSAGRTFYTGSKRMSPIAIETIAQEIGLSLKNIGISAVSLVFHSPVDYLIRGIIRNLRPSLSFSGFNYYLNRPHNGLRKPASRRV